MRAFMILFCMVLFSANARGQIATHVVISEVYGGGGNKDATYKNDFVELYNPTASAVDLTGWSVQYASSAGTTWRVTQLTGSIPAYGFYLIQEAQGDTGTVDLPTPDALGSITMAATAGKVALVNSTTALSGGTPSSSSIVDLVGYGSATFYEGSGAAPDLSNTTSAERKARASSTAASMQAGGADDGSGNGYDTGDNSNDFVEQSAINPQNSSSSPETPPDIPLPVTMSGLSARVDGGQVCISFSTSSETNLAGFNVLRANERSGPFALVSGCGTNASLKASGSCTSGSKYSFVDSKVEAGKTYYYKIEAVNISGVSESAGEILEVVVDRAESFRLYQNYPNPFNPSTIIGFAVPGSGTQARFVSVKIYDVLGREVRTLVNEIRESGNHEVHFDASGLPGGVYFCRIVIESGDGSRNASAMKMILMK